MLINPFQAAYPTSPHTIFPIGAADPTPCYRAKPFHSTPIWDVDHARTRNGHTLLVQVVNKNAIPLPMQQNTGVTKVADLRAGILSVLLRQNYWR
jgi:hypothetical protein